MKIRDIQTGELYQLAPDSTLEIERTNPFFSDGGEQSLPMELPDTPQNRRLTGNLAELATDTRPDSGTEVEIEDGAYHVRANQTVLSACRNKSINTLFLLAQSSFYALVGDLSLIDLFGDDKIEGVTTVDEAIAWLKSLSDHTDPDFDVFPVAMTLPDSSEHSFGYRLMNAIGHIFTHLDGSGQEFWPAPYTPSQLVSERIWLNDSDRTAMHFLNDDTLNLQQGYYMTPFVRVIHILKRVVSSLGCTLIYDEDDTVISRMVFVNNTIDSIVTGEGILYRDLIPDCSCSDLLDMFRYKFNVEFIYDAVARTVTMHSFADMAASTPEDITPYVASQPEIDCPEVRKRISLVPSGALSGDAAPSASETLRKYPAPRWDAVRGGWIVQGKRGTVPVTELVLDGNAGYNTGEASGFEEDEHKSPDKIPSLVALKDAGVFMGVQEYDDTWVFPYIGEERALHSRKSSDAEEDDNPALTERPQLDMMVLLPFTDYRGYPRGGLTAYDYYRYFRTRSAGQPFQQGSLCYYGDDGLFERYWRCRDELTRNALNTVRVSLLLPARLKMTLSPYRRVLIHNTPLLIDTLNLSLGQDDALSQSTLLTATPQKPLSHAPQTGEIVHSDYRWQLKRVFTTIGSIDIYNSPGRVFPSQTPSATLVGEICCEQYEEITLEYGEATLYDINNDSWNNPAPPGCDVQDGRLVNRDPYGHPMRFHIRSYFICVIDE